jgi:dTMP kinase
VVVCNRYVSANLAHQGGKIQAQDKRVAFQKWVEELEYDVFGLPRPDLHVWLDMPPEVAVTLVARKADRKYLQKGRDIHESSMAHLRATREVYRQLAAGPGWVTVECAAGDRPLPSEAVAAKVWEGVRQVVTE